MNKRIMTVVAVGVAIGVGFGSASAGIPGYYISGEGGVSLLPDLTIKDTLEGKQSDSFATGFAAAERLAMTPATAFASN